MHKSSNQSNMLVGQFQQLAEILSNGHSRNNEMIPKSTYALNLLNPISRPFTNTCTLQERQSTSPNESTYTYYSTSPSSFNTSNLSTSPDKLSVTTHKRLPVRSHFVNMKEHLDYARVVKLTCNKNIYCAFCKSNGETEDIYTSHMLKDSQGKTTCPILKVHMCPICYATGEQAHTLTYCKKFKQMKRMEVIQKNL